MERSWEKRVGDALALKEHGNTHYRSGNYRDAISKYRQALLGLDITLPQGSDEAEPTSDEWDSIRRLLVDCHNNLAGHRLSMYRSMQRSTLPERWSLAGELTLSYALPAADG